MPNNKPMLLIAEAEDFNPNAIKILKDKFHVTLFDPSSQKWDQNLRQTEILWIRLKHRIDASAMDNAPHLKLIATPTTGLNHIDLDEAKRRKIRIVSLKGETEFLRNIRATAELTVALLLALMRNVPAAIESTRNGFWKRNLFKGNELAGKCVGIIGHGRLGKIVSDYMIAFGCSVVASDPHPVEKPNVPLVPISELLSKADIVSLHVCLTDESRGFFNRDCFEKIKRGAYFINTSRGELVDETMLLKALESGKIKAAALDVVSNENQDEMENHPLLKYSRSHENLIITPHIGGATFESMQKTELFLAKKMKSIKIH